MSGSPAACVAAQARIVGAHHGRDAVEHAFLEVVAVDKMLAHMADTAVHGQIGCGRWRRADWPTGWRLFHPPYGARDRSPCQQQAGRREMEEAERVRPHELAAVPEYRSFPRYIRGFPEEGICADYIPELFPGC